MQFQVPLPRRATETEQHRAVGRDAGINDVDVHDERAERVRDNPIIDGPVRVAQGAGPWGHDGGPQLFEENH